MKLGMALGVAILPLHHLRVYRLAIRPAPHAGCRMRGSRYAAAFYASARFPPNGTCLGTAANDGFTEVCHRRPVSGSAAANVIGKVAVCLFAQVRGQRHPPHHPTATLCSQQNNVLSGSYFRLDPGLTLAGAAVVLPLPVACRRSATLTTALHRRPLTMPWRLFRGRRT